MAIYKLENLSFKQVAELDKDKTVVVFTCGSMEQHGPHLPIGMDTQCAAMIAERVLKNVENEMDCLWIPPIPFGQSPEHMDFAGTITFTAETYIRMLKEIACSVARHGFKKMYIINGHGGNISAIGAASFDIRDSYKLQMFMFNVWGVIVGLANDLHVRDASNKTDAHGGEIETALMLHLTPENVHMEWAVDEKNEKLAIGEVVGLGGPIGFNWNSLQDVAPSGISGIASLGTAEKGKVIFEALVDMATKGLREVHQNW
jgi:creatinine amidohydrolase